MLIRSRLWHPLRSFRAWRELRGRHTISNGAKRELPLREFVYLDAVSLHSLLVSQSETIPEAITQAVSRANEAELIGTVNASVGNEFVGKADSQASTRYQTSNSDSSQSSRKAVIQTLFKELRELPLDFKLVSPTVSPGPFSDVNDISRVKSDIADNADAFTRGTLVEVEVVLAVDPVFKLGAMMNEWSAMADDVPGVFANHGTLGFLRESAPIMKVLDRFLAGLIPIKATAVNYVVVTVSGIEYVVHKDAIAGLEMDFKPLRITGVTEHLGYWKDIRRVLFSEARFTMLCRVARNGLHDKWTPVKLADLFSEVAPGFVDQINAIRPPTTTDGDSQLKSVAMADALVRYKDAISSPDTKWTDDDNRAFVTLVAGLTNGATDPLAQREAFDRVREFAAARSSDLARSPEDDFNARRDARGAAGLALFPALPSGGVSATFDEREAGMNNPVTERVLDTEVIAIYW